MSVQYRGEIEVAAATHGLDADLVQAALTEPSPSDVVRNFQKSRQLRYGNLFAFIRPIHVLPLIVVLLQPCRPSTIPRGVRTVIVHSIQALTVRAPAHVLKECGEVVQPFVAHGDSASTVVIVLLGCGRDATTFGVLPSDVLLRQSATTGIAVGRRATLNGFNVETSTTLCSSFPKCAPWSNNNGSAVTLTYPVRFNVRYWVPSRYGQSSKASPGHIDESHSPRA